jgi:hypothetical protein
VRVFFWALRHPLRYYQYRCTLRNYRLIVRVVKIESGMPRSFLALWSSLFLLAIVGFSGGFLVAFVKAWLYL